MDHCLYHQVVSGIYREPLIDYGPLADLRVTM